MEKITQYEFEESLKDVRMAYRLLAVYQRRLLDTVDFIFNEFETTYGKWYGHFSDIARSGKSIDLKSWSWDWLPMYLCQFKSVEISIDQDNYYLQIIHMGDSGFFDLNNSTNADKAHVEKFYDISISDTKLLFTFSKNDNGAPLEKILKNRLKEISLKEIVTEGNWAALVYPMKDFYNESTTRKVISDLKMEFSKAFKISIP